MQTFKLGDFVCYKKWVNYPAVYVFRSGRKIYYVGATKNFGGRMKDHIRNVDRYSSKPIAVAMQNSRGVWRNWDVNVYSTEECEIMFGSQSSDPLTEGVFVAEAKMMVRLKPRLNVRWPADFGDCGLDGASHRALTFWHQGDKGFARTHAQMCLHMHRANAMLRKKSNSIIGD